MYHSADISLLLSLNTFSAPAVCKLSVSDVYSDSESEDLAERKRGHPSSKIATDSVALSQMTGSHSTINFNELSVGKWVVVDFDRQLYPGEITRINHEEHIEVNVMHSAPGGVFFWPLKIDQIPYPFSDVKAIINPPIPTQSGSRKVYYVFPDCKNILFPEL